ncbi:ABC transporter permease subunit [Lolliginicoccus levis]|uniref:ABC transporter permease subunit n=1 Tax=Lolliginicoccus levis TaxID=2919542 RepID=UPI00241DE74F|nr:ABC transporter permease subunit [Lolliginicoccus levis]
MLRSVFTKALRDQRRALAGWGTGLVLLLLLMAALWPSLADMGDLEAFLASFPEPMQELFNLEEYGTGVGYYNTELFTAMLPILFLAFGIGRGARAVAGDEENGTLDAVLLTRVSPRGLLVQQAAAVAVAITLLGTVVLVCAVAFSAIFGLGVGVGAAASGALAITLLGLEFGWLSLAIGAATGSRIKALALSSAAAVAAYVLYLAGALVDGVRPWQPLSPFYQALADGPVGAGLPWSYLWMLLAAVVFVLAAIPLLERRDIGR